MYLYAYVSMCLFVVYVFVCVYVCVGTNVCVCVRVGMSCVLRVKVLFLKDVSSVLHVEISLKMYDISCLNNVCSVFDIIVNP